MVKSLAEKTSAIYDWVDSPQRRRVIENSAVFLAAGGFVAHLILILLARTVPALGNGFLAGLDRNFLHSVYTPFSFILFLEVLLLVLALPKSHTSSIGKQYEIISLIVVRRVFKDIGEFRDLGSWLTQREATQTVLFDMAGAVAMFLLVTLFYRVRQQVVKSPSHHNLQSFILVKKIIALLLTLLLFLLAAYNLVVWVMAALPGIVVTNAPENLDLFFFPTFFEVMIFTDVFLLILSISYYDRYEYVFRNAGFVISTVLLRFSLSTTKPYDVALAVVAMTYGLAVLAVFAYFTRVVDRVRIKLELKGACEGRPESPSESDA